MLHRLLEMRPEDHQREELEQYLGADHCGVGGRVVLRGDLDDIPRRRCRGRRARAGSPAPRAASGRRPRVSRARGEGRVEAIHVEGNIGRPAADDRRAPARRRPRCRAGRHPRCATPSCPSRKRIPRRLGRAADADLNRPLGVEHAGEYRLAKRPAMVEFRAVDLPHRIAMRRRYGTSPTGRACPKRSERPRIMRCHWPNCWTAITELKMRLLVRNEKSVRSTTRSDQPVAVGKAVVEPRCGSAGSGPAPAPRRNAPPSRCA